MKNKKIVQLTERFEALKASENVSIEELLKISLELDKLIEESHRSKLAM